MDETFAFARLILLAIVVCAVLAMIKWPKAGLSLLGVLVLLAIPAMFMARLHVQTSSSPPLALPQITPRVTIDFGDPTTAPTTQTTGKSWVDNWESFVNSAQPTQRWVRAGTTTPAATEAEARAEARKQAAIILGPTVLSVVRSDPRSIPGSNIVINDKWIREQISTSLEKSEFIADEFISRTERPYGDIWTCQLLLDASPEKIADVTQTYRLAAQRKLTVAATSWGGLCMLGVVIILLYAFLNAVTKGYFVWRLRAAAVMVLLIAVLIVMSIM